MTLISHEIPKSLFPVHDLINDYPYVLAHLIGEDIDYTNFYVEKCRNSSYSILDNSAFELGKSVDFETLLKAAAVVKPTHVVIPDVVNNCEETIALTNKFVDHLLGASFPNGKIPFKLIAVLQGRNMAEIQKCLDNVTSLSRKLSNIAIVALPFDTIPGTDYHNVRPIVFQKIKRQLKDNYLKVHLLGLQNYSEYYLYSKEDKELIHSVDSSAPIIYGWNGIKFGFGGTDVPKPKEKLADNLDKQISEDMLQVITHNVLHIRSIIQNGTLRS